MDDIMDDNMDDFIDDFMEDVLSMYLIYVYVSSLSMLKKPMYLCLGLQVPMFKKMCFKVF